MHMRKLAIKCPCILWHSYGTAFALLYRIYSKKRHPRMSAAPGVELEKLISAALE